MSCGCDLSQIVNGPTTECDCPAPGFCPRHKCDKHSWWWTLCRTRPDYFMAWEEGRGPGQPVRFAWARPGDCLALLIRLITLGRAKSGPACGCDDRRYWLNDWGRDQLRRSEIVRALLWLWQRVPK